MIPADLYDLGREALVLVLMLSLPILAVALLSGVIAGIFQSFTKMSEPTINHVARAIAVLLALIAVAPWMAEHLRSFAEQTWAVIQKVPR